MFSFIQDVQNAHENVHENSLTDFNKEMLIRNL